MVEGVRSVPLTTIELVAYASLALELTVLHVPSIASSSSIWSRPPAVEAAYSPSYRALFSMSCPKKVMLFGLPVLVIYGVYLYPLLTLWGPPDPLGDHVLATSVISNALAALLIVVGRVITLGSVLTLRKESRRAAAAPVLHTGGPFRHSRNPGLVGMYVFVAGLWLAGPSLTMLGGILIYVIYMDFKVRMEEDYLQNRFGGSYQAYRQSASRYWP